ncbi:transposase [Halanaerobium sp. Z-7514]|uniref:Transposase n=1 Tax=Halanaerobium polyolivorans TaxID=2886943 RepID=A0AAW4X2K8_9FIRM|nr:transposase [Halanaerobium polyolivorans]MCC3146049.1 transposase [Halanaerobium polyolivorans]
MSKNTKRSPEEKMEIVLEGLQNDDISETCRKHGIYESQFNQWKKRLIGSAAEEKRKLMDIVEESTIPVKTTCEKLKLNSWRYYDWRKRYKAEGITISLPLPHALTAF